MKRCPSCNRNYTDDTLRFCLEDGTPLTQAPLDEPTITTPPAEPPATVIYGAPIPPPTPAPWITGNSSYATMVIRGYAGPKQGSYSVRTDREVVPHFNVIQ